YVYDWWGDVQQSPSAYAVERTFTYLDLGLDVNFKNPETIYVHGDELYICDTGNNRIVVLRKTVDNGFEYVKTISSVKGISPEGLNAPSDLEINENGDIFICDRGNNRLIKADKDLNYICSFEKPDDSTLDPELVFQPTRMVIDTADRVYCIATGINKGLIKYEEDAVFSGFVGATPVSYNFADWLWKKLFASQEQRAQMLAFVPTEYSNLFMDKKGFIYAVTDKALDEDLDSGKMDAVRKLNMLGSDILVRNGEWPVFGDLYWGNAAGISGASAFTDVTVLDNDVYVCLDKKRCRLFGYDDQGKLVFVFGGNGNMDGYFRQPASIEHFGRDLVVLDSLDNAITYFTPTEFGSLVYKAMELFDQGKYDESQQAWEQVMALDGSYDLAYIGIGRALLRTEHYKEAMEYFELKYDDENYSKAFQQYRKQWINENIGWIIAVILVLVLVPSCIGWVRKMKYQVDNADIFRK
nr:hypothetical protein [Lachnospiraceae bacterium]